MTMRDMLTRMMTPSGGGGGAPVDAAAYQKLLEENMGRVGYDRDQAVRSANIAAGFGNSTAQRFMHEAGPVPGGGGGGAAPVDPMQTGAVPMPTARPAPPPMEPGIGSGIPMPEAGIGSGIPTPQLPGMPSIGSGIPMPPPGQYAPVPTHRPGGITMPKEGIGSGIPEPSTPNVGAPVPAKGGSQYRLQREKKKPKKKAA